MHCWVDIIEVQTAYLFVLAQYQAFGSNLETVVQRSLDLANHVDSVSY